MFQLIFKSSFLPEVCDDVDIVFCFYWSVKLQNIWLSFKFFKMFDLCLNDFVF